MTVKEKMHAGEPYVMADDPELMKYQQECLDKLFEYNSLRRPKQRKRRRC